MPEVEIPFNEIQNEPSSSLSSLSSSNELSSQISNDDGGLQSSQSSNNLSDYEVNALPLIHHERQLPMYDNIILPSEPSLDELLKQVAGTNDLAAVEEIHLRVVSHAISLQRIHLFMPNLKILNLEGSDVSSLRDLGCDITTLKCLNVSRCGLKSFDGTNGLGSVEELIADFNVIRDISPCCSLQNLTKLSLISNRMSNIHSVTFLELCPKLKNLNLLDNPVARTVNYRDLVKRAIPQLAILDEVIFCDSQTYNDFSSSEYQSSTTTSPDNSLGNEVTMHQNKMVIQRNIVNQRPATAGCLTNSSSELTSGEPYCGNIVTRRRRRRVAWADANDEVRDGSSNSSTSSTKSFPNLLPQQAVELELGVIGCQVGHDDDENLTTESLLEIARKWRFTSQTTRDTIKHYEDLKNDGTR